jgi:hypothetical protein
MAEHSRILDGEAAERARKKQEQERMVQLNYNKKLTKSVLAGAVVAAAAYLLSGRTKRRRHRRRRTKRVYT